jgi:hypothetical protein
MLRVRNTPAHEQPHHEPDAKETRRGHRWVLADIAFPGVQRFTGFVARRLPRFGCRLTDALRLWVGR